MADEAKTAELRIKLDGADVARGADQIEGRLDRLASKAKQAGGEAAKGFEQMPEGAKKAAKSIEDADNRIIASLKRKAAEAEAYGKGEAARQEALIRARGRDPEVFRDYLNALSAAERGNKQFLATQQGMSAASRELRVETNLTKNALRQLPAQFTDIVTSLQGGQKPMTVLLQQGGQLKDVFGGVGNAARAMGGYIAGLISPLSVAIAALGTVGYAFLKVQAEGAEYTKALVMSGNAAGGTTAQYKAMAKAIGDIGGPTQGRAAEVIASMASSALIGASNIQRFTAAALAMERAGGAAAEKTAEQFAALGKAPLDASVKLNESMNYLTRSTYDQIRALEEQGRTVEAAAAAQAAFADALEQRAPQMESALGLVERGWRRVADGAKAAWDAILNIGRSNGIDLQIKELSAQADRLRAAAGNRGVASPGQFVTALGGQSYEAQAAEIDKVIAKLRESKQLNDSVAASQAEQAKQVKALADYRKDEAQYLTKSEQANRAVTKAIVEGVAAGEKMEAIQRRVAAIQERYKDKRAGSTTESEIDLLNRLVGLTSTYNNDIAILNKRLAERKLTEEQYGEAVRKLVEVQPYMVKYTKEQADAIEKENKAYVRALEARARYIENEEKILDADKKTLLSLQARAAGLRDGKEATEELLAVEVLRQANTLEALAISRYEQTLDDAQLARDRERVEVLRMIAIERRNIAQAIDDDQVEKANKKAADEAARDWERAADEIGKSLTDAIMAGGDNAAKYLRDLFRKLVLRPIIQSVVQQYGGVVGAALGGGTGQAGQYMQGAQSLQTLYGYGQAGYGYLASNGYLGGSAAYGAATDSALATSGNYYAADAAASSSAAGVSSVASYAGWAALAAVIYTKGMQDYEAGFRRDQARETGTIAGRVTADTSDLLSKLGVSDKWADFFGATAVAATIGRAAPQITGSGIQGSLGGGQFTGTGYADIYEKGGFLRSGNAYQSLTALPDDLARFMDAAAKGVMDKAKEFGDALGLPVESLASITTQIKLNLGDTLGDNEQDIKDALAAYGDALVAGWAEALKPVALYGETTLQTIERVGAAIKATNEVLGLLEVPLLAASVAGGQAAAALADSFGGLDKLQAASAAYYQEFFTEEERKANTLKSLTAALGDVGLALPASRDAFRDLVSGLDLTTQAGREQFTTLMGVASAFAELNPVLEETAAAIDKAAEAFANAMKSLTEDRASLEVDLLMAQGNTSGARALGRSQFLSGVGEVSPEQLGAIAAAYDYNQALRDQITALEDAADAAEQAAQRTAEIASERAGLDRQVLQLQGDTAAIRQIERNALDESNRAIYDRITALQDEATAAEKAARAEQEAAADRRTLDAAASGQAKRVLSPQAYEQFQLAKISDKSGIDVATLLGATKQQVIDFAVAFVQAGENSTEAKLAMIEAASALLDIKDAALTAARDIRASELQTELDDIAKVFGDLSVVANDTQTLSDAYRENRDAIADLESSLDSLLGVIEPTIQQTLAGLLQTRQALAGARESLAETIFGTQLRTLAPDARIAALRGQESALFGQLATAQDPAAVAGRLQAVVLQRIKEEATLRATVQQVTIDGLQQTIALTEQQRRDQLDALRDQIDALQNLKRLAQDIAQFTGEMRFSDLSPLSPEAQLSAARALFEGTLESAQAGDENAQGNLTSNARAYLEEARAYFASSADYAGIFATVLGSLDSLGLTAGAVDPQIAAIEAQAAALQSVSEVLIDTSAEELAALQTIDSALAAREGTLTTAIADQTAAAREQIAELRRTADGQEAQLRQAAARHTEITAEMERINTTLTRILTNTELAGAAP